MSKEMAAALFSLEMPIPSITERYQSIVTGASGSDIEATYESNEPRALKIKDEFKKNFIKELNNLFVIPTRVSISDISDYINLIELEHNVKIGVVEAAKRTGSEIVIDDNLPKELNDMAATLSKVKALKPDVLVVSGHTKGALTAIRQLSEMRVNVPMLAMNTFSSW